MKTNIIIQGNALDVLKTLPEKSIDMSMSSPPYWALRDYGTETETIWDDENCEHEFEIEEKKNPMDRGGKGQHDSSGIVGKMGDKTQTIVKSGFCKKCGAWKGQLGLEPTTFDLYIKHLCDIYDEVKRVLKDEGTCWVNLGDTYYGGGGSAGHTEETKNLGYKTKSMGAVAHNWKSQFLPNKCLTLIPMRFAIEMINRGWILRNVIIWHKPNCMPSSVKDRFTVDFEYIFFFSKKKKYYFETQYERLAPTSEKDRRKDKGRFEYKGKRKDAVQNAMCGINSKGRNKRCVWKICPKPFKEAHFAVYPEELCETPIKAGCPEFVCVKCGKPKIKVYKKIGEKKVPPIGGIKQVKNINPVYSGKEKQNVYDVGEYKPTCNCNAGFEGGIVLDHFFGAGTTGLVALKLNRKFIGIELNQEYIKIAKERLKPYLEKNEKL